MPYKKGHTPHNKGDHFVKGHFRDAPNVKRDLDFKIDSINENFLTNETVKPFGGKKIGF